MSGGIELYYNSQEQPIIDKRFEAINTAVITGDPVQASEIVEADRTSVREVFPIAYAASSQESGVSDLSPESVNWFNWFYSEENSNPDRRGGRRIRKSRRNNRKRVSKKRRKKGLKTKKAKKYSRTVKRH